MSDQHHTTMHNIIFDTPRTFTVELSEIVKYSVEIKADSTLDLMEQIHAIDEDGEFDADESIVAVNERTIDTVLDAAGEPIDYVSPEDVVQSPATATDDPLYTERHKAAEDLFLTHDFPTPVRAALTDWERVSSNEWQRTYGLEPDSGNPNEPPVPSVLTIRFHPGTAQATAVNDSTHYPAP